ncbi:hypothetical protein DSO57_1010896 [Entomophthora muscae]|uniref:Uncharacterized protein n=1 Tax=Entomophthora muscae TaxID=34485 RepID=A0ACC2T7E0_9FUNG|nr:hypothetical protein DSO57_1010896 [Entomophthora muscae]
MLVASDPTVLVVSIHIFVFVSSVLPRLSLATPSRDYSSRAASLLLAALLPVLTYPKKPRTSHPNFTVHQELPLAQYILPSTHPTRRIWSLLWRRSSSTTLKLELERLKLIIPARIFGSNDSAPHPTPRGPTAHKNLLPLMNPLPPKYLG